jgi:phage terminase large subunit-like protein
MIEETKRVKNLDEVMKGFVPANQRQWYPFIWKTSAELFTLKNNKPEEYKQYWANIKKLAREDFFFFCDEIMRDKESPHLQIGLHDELCYLAQQNDDVVLLIPRGHLKTTICNVYHTIWVLGHNPNLRILTTSETKPIAQKFLNGIKLQIESNERLHFVFPELKIARSKSKTTMYEKQNQDELLVERTKIYNESSITVMGAGQTMTGMHFDLQKYDDIMTATNSKTPEQRTKVKHAYDMSLALLNPSGRIMIIGTRYDDDDLYGYIEEQNEYPMYVRECVENDEYIWKIPEVIELIEANKRRMNPYIFSCQYHNSPIVTGEEEFKPDWIQRWDMIDVREYMQDNKNDAEIVFNSWIKTLNIYLGCDPNRAQRKSVRNDFCSMMVVGVDMHKRKFILDKYKDKPTSSLEITQKFCDMFQKWNPIRAGIEAVGGDAHLLSPIREELKKRRLPANRFIEFKTTTSIPGDDRVRGMQSDFELGEVYIRQGAAYEDLIQELLHFPHAKHDDEINTLAYILTQLVKTPKEKKKKNDDVWYLKRKSRNNSYNWQTKD